MQTLPEHGEALRHPPPPVPPVLGGLGRWDAPRPSPRWGHPGIRGGRVLGEGHMHPPPRKGAPGRAPPHHAPRPAGTCIGFSFPPATTPEMGGTAPGRGVVPPPPVQAGPPHAASPPAHGHSPPPQPSPQRWHPPAPQPPPSQRESLSGGPVSPGTGRGGRGGGVVMSGAGEAQGEPPPPAPPKASPVPTPVSHPRWRGDTGRAARVGRAGGAHP